MYPQYERYNCSGYLSHEKYVKVNDERCNVYANATVYVYVCMYVRTVHTSNLYIREQ